jgi:hypothetical protein
MSWLFSQALVEEYSAASSLDGEQCAPSRLNHTLQAYLSLDKMTEFSRLSRFGMTFAPLTESLGVELLTWFLEDSRVKILVQQEPVLELMENDPAYGAKWPASLAKYNHATRLWKTAQCSLFEDLEPSLETWPRWGLMLDGECWALETSAMITCEKESGLLPTPSGTSNHGKNHVSGRLDEWGGSSNPFRKTEIGKVHCAGFEEWMMGWPVQWTGLTPLGMDRFHMWQQQHSLCLHNDQQLIKETA